MGGYFVKCKNGKNFGMYIYACSYSFVLPKMAEERALQPLLNPPLYKTSRTLYISELV